MTLTVTQADIARPPVAVALTALPIVDATYAAGAVTGIVQRSSNGGIAWDTVRGMVDMTIDGSGAVDTVDDYEFEPGVDNDYRGGVMQQVVATFASTASSAWPAADTGQTWDASGSQWNGAGGLGTILHASTNTSYLTLLTTPTDMGDCRIGVTFKGSASSISGGVVQWGVRAHHVDTSNFYDTNIEVTPTTNVMTLRTRVRFGGALTALVTTVLPDTYASTKSFRVEVDVTGAVFKARVWDPVARPRPDWQAVATVPAGLRIMAGKIGIASFRDTANSNANFTTSVNDVTANTGTPTFLSGQTDDITPGLAGVWLCSTLRSFLNCAPLIVAYEEPERLGRGGAVSVAGRTLPIGQVEVMGGRSWKVTFRATSLASARRLEYLFASGDIMFVQTPADCPIPRGYYRIDRMDGKRVTPRSDKRLFDIPLSECARPGPDIATAQNTWDSVFLTYGTWEQLAATGLTWEQLRDNLIGDPSEVIVG